MPWALKGNSVNPWALRGKSVSPWALGGRAVRPWELKLTSLGSPPCLAIKFEVAHGLFNGVGVLKTG